jgi:mRNA-degrading endonuclease YafQ of YafQ-DinJ toxin-antitoxin module
MSYTLEYSKNFVKKIAKFIKKHPDLKSKVYKTFELLEENPFHPSLRLHRLKGILKEYHSVSIDMKYRVLIDLIVTDEKIILLDIGTHDEVY